MQCVIVTHTHSTQSETVPGKLRDVVPQTVVPCYSVYLCGLNILGKISREVVFVPLVIADTCFVYSPTVIHDKKQLPVAIHELTLRPVYNDQTSSKASSLNSYSPGSTEGRNINIFRACLCGSHGSSCFHTSLVL